MKRNIYRLIMSALLVSVGLTSCLNDDMIDDQKYGLINLNANKIIEIPADASHEISMTFKPTDGLKEVVIGEVRLAAESPAAEDVVVNLTASKSAEILGASVALFPLNKIQVPASVTIPKGQRSIPLVVKISTEVLTDNPQYIAVSVATVNNSGYIISGNFGHLTLNLKAKNKYEGRYVLTGKMDYLPNLASYLHITTAFEGEPYTVQLKTVNGRKLKFYDELTREDYLYPMAVGGGGTSAWGSFCPIFEFDDNGNVVAVTNSYGQPASNTRSAVLDPAGVNKYDAATKSFQVSYYMVQPSAVATAPHYRCHMVETYTFKENL